jgi:MFS family permease
MSDRHYVGVPPTLATQRSADWPVPSSQVRGAGPGGLGGIYAVHQWLAAQPGGDAAGLAGRGLRGLATSMQTAVYNIGIAAGSLAGGLILQRAGAGALPWATSLLSAAALASVAAARRRAFPADRTARENERPERPRPGPGAGTGETVGQISVT